MRSAILPASEIPGHTSAGLLSSMKLPNLPNNDRPFVSGGIEVTLTPVRSAAELEDEWRSLEARSDCLFFTSWSWIGCWLECLPAQFEPLVLRATIEGRVVGLAIVVPRALRRNKIVFVNALFLNTTGDPFYDQITIEYNGFLLERASEDKVEDAMWLCLRCACPRVEEMRAETMRAMIRAPTSSDFEVKTWIRRSFLVDLQRVRDREGSLVAVLKQKPRYAIRRSMRQYGEIGALRIEVAQDVQAALSALEQLKMLHQSSWNSRGKPGAFANDFLNAFHDRLIKQSFLRGEIQVVSIYVGDRTLGVLYNFVFRGRVYTYQAGLDHSVADRTDSPGLVAHCLAVEFNARQGHEFYDFMVGDHLYKRSLSTSMEELYSVVVQRRKLKFAIEDKLRAWKRAARSRTQQATDAVRA